MQDAGGTWQAGVQATVSSMAQVCEARLTNYKHFNVRRKCAVTRHQNVNLSSLPPRACTSLSTTRTQRLSPNIVRLARRLSGSTSSCTRNGEGRCWRCRSPWRERLPIMIGSSCGSHEKTLSRRSWTENRSAVRMVVGAARRREATGEHTTATDSRPARRQSEAFMHLRDGSKVEKRRHDCYFDHRIHSGS